MQLPAPEGKRTLRTGIRLIGPVLVRGYLLGARGEIQVTSNWDRIDQAPGYLIADGRIEFGSLPLYTAGFTEAA
ncbi:MAG: hypothetical protein HY362_00290 [Candidatus Aenigmarchaeota archaeon]|nr:hypothetical protein [Candidatus Aenigmarchaeota archaeon]